MCQTGIILVKKWSCQKVLNGINLLTLFLAGPQLDWDPDIVAGLDEDFNFDDPENQLGDDFVVQAMGEDVDCHEEEEAIGEIGHQK